MLLTFLAEVTVSAQKVTSSLRPRAVNTPNLIPLLPVPLLSLPPSPLPSPPLDAAWPLVPTLNYPSLLCPVDTEAPHGKGEK